MKKLVSIIMTAVLVLSLSITAMADNATMVSIGKYSSVSNRSDYNFAKLTYLEKSFLMKNNKLEVKEDEFLLIPKGVKLYLDKGAEIRGNIYVASGGYLYIRGGDVDICEGGSVYVDGYISISSKNTVALDRGSEIFVNKSGTLKITSDKSLSTDSLGDIICIGNTNSNSSMINKKVVAAFVNDEKGTVMAAGPDALLPKTKNYTTFVGKIDVGTKQRVIFVFDKGACLKTDKRNDEFKFIGNTCIGIAGSYLYNDDFGNGINEIVTINGKDYTADISNSGYLCRMTDDLKPIDYSGDKDDSLMTEAINNISEHKYLGKARNGLPVYMREGASIYLMDNGYILAIQDYKIKDERLIPPAYKGATQEELAQLKWLALYEPV